ncbi:hypothetical protein JTE90_005068 [Oedothorax gibbosus]|uniref:Uncharacterized protein n=1 Tax=Oedothorax gibbosus TaxID=931172 RepID=A0AAV6VB01_9ARAC|nr:hypothetical protein JTE90_005068 [Oedothorax gibbosus]
MNKILTLLISLSAIFYASAERSGYTLVINHIPKYGWQKGGEGFGRSIRYDIRQYPDPVVAEKSRAEILMELLQKSEMLDYLKSPFARFYLKENELL